MGDSSAGSWKRSRVVISRANLDDLSNAEHAALSQFSRLLRTVQQVKDARHPSMLTPDRVDHLSRTSPHSRAAIRQPLAAVVDRLRNAFEDERPRNSVLRRISAVACDTADQEVNRHRPDSWKPSRPAHPRSARQASLTR